MATPAIAIFTGKATSTILGLGGSQSWVLDRNKAGRYKYAVLYFNSNAHWSPRGFAEHGDAFLVGRIADIVPSSDTAGRWKVVFDAYAEAHGMGTWGGWRNPIRYTTLEELGIDGTELHFQPMPELPEKPAAAREISLEPVRLTIETAKAGLAATYGVKPDAIEIIIRG